MPSFYSRVGDDGYTGLLGKGRVKKSDPRLEAIGTLDEANAALGLARAFCQSEAGRNLLVKIQRDFYLMMTEAATSADHVEKFHRIDDQSVKWLEEQTELLAQNIHMPGEFIVPGDTCSSAMVDLARTVVRRAERRMTELFHRRDITDQELLRYLNRLSSLLFVLELNEIQAAGVEKPLLAKGSEE